MPAILFQLTTEDADYLGAFKSQVREAGLSGAINTSDPVLIAEVLMRMREKNCSAVATSSVTLLKLLLTATGVELGRKKASIDDYAGSIIEVQGVEFLIINPIKQLFTKSEGKFIFQRYLKKFARPNDWLVIPRFTWELFNPATIKELFARAENATFISCDIETVPGPDRLISCVGFSFVTIDRRRNSYEIRTTVIPFTEDFNVAVVGTILATKTPKVFQNGKYDNAYLLRFCCPTTNWCGDTLNAFHSWYCELPKSLDYITSFVIRKWQFWKNEASTQDIMKYYEYNAKDCFTTAICWLGLMREMPAWAWNNYYMEFPLTFPCMLTEMTGIARDNAAAEEEEKKFTIEIDRNLERLRLLMGEPKFNPNSYKQVLQMFTMCGSKDLTSTDDANMDKFKSRHPLNELLGTAIEDIRDDRKMVSAYLKDEKSETGEPKTWNGRIFYALNPYGTDTGRLASRESAFWCGWQIQNWPRDREDINLKRTAVSDKDFLFGEGDYEQAEARDVAYLSGDSNLIAAVDDETRDFHGTNASAFFGIPYDEIVQSSYSEEINAWVHKTINKALRDTSKRTNHGANYNMTAPVLLATMGIKAAIRAQAALRLPANWTLLRVCGHLLAVYDKTYPVVRGPYYEDIKNEIARTKMLVGPTGWTRYCFGKPADNKRDMNRYAAHRSQSLNAMVLNKAYMNTYTFVWRPHHKIFKLGPQIHDSILFQYHKDEPWLIEEVKKHMTITVKVKDIFGITRDLTVPVAMKSGATRWSETH